MALVLPLLEAEKRGLGYAGRIRHLAQRQVDAIDLLVLQTVCSGVFF